MSETKNPRVPTKKTAEPEVRVQKQDLYQKVENVFMHNRNIIVGVIGVIVIAILGYFGYKQLYLGPKEEQAETKIAFAQINFGKDSLQLALNGDGINPGFTQIISDYGNTTTGNLAKYYAGNCYLKLKDFDNAIKNLEDYKPATDELSGLTHLQLGHAYAEKNDFPKAIENYKKAGETAKSDIYSPYYYKLAGDLMAMQQDYKGAKEVYQIIKRDYPLSEEGQGIDKDIAYTETKLGE
ncbi:MAG: tetratricopeptide repeat protein [Chitinophagales bacterium]|nr:tetratricopeptide repeat protein [Chitinophagales bacterium]